MSKSTVITQIIFRNYNCTYYFCAYLLCVIIGIGNPKIYLKNNCSNNFSSFILITNLFYFLRSLVLCNSRIEFRSNFCINFPDLISNTSFIHCNYKKNPNTFLCNPSVDLKWPKSKLRLKYKALRGQSCQGYC